MISLSLSLLHFVDELIVEEGLLLSSMKTFSGNSATTVPSRSDLADDPQRNQKSLSNGFPTS